MRRERSATRRYHPGVESLERRQVLSKSAAVGGPLFAPLAEREHKEAPLPLRVPVVAASTEARPVRVTATSFAVERATRVTAGTALTIRGRFRAGADPTVVFTDRA